ncbi:hypothetical protein B1813_18420 [Saccharomonospora piscinae]|uniref:HTH arsR-type domain-containing protein n=1 Tax=Saccharomonospora piscinae TaxID=687388 RepID=A0A1V8ZYW9_SACPI|nr:winged helix-turn-helix domain-containing protein [Saccharomonospora piscinae]OQO90119.1 hypothetical protein B1813_18420 [Saccharomonospora piscinae]
MQRIEFTVEDLTKVRLGNSLGAVAETIFAINLFEQSRVRPFGEWRKQVRDQLKNSPLLSRLDSARANRMADPLWMLNRSSGNDEGAELIHQFFRVGVAPYWPRLQSLLRAERDARSRIVATGGVDLLFNSLGPKVRWRAPVLEIANDLSGDVRLDGRGLLLSPSVFVASHSAVLIESEPASGRPVLVFATPVDKNAGAWLWGQTRRSENALAALVGRTRAASLRALTDSCTTGELAHRLGISMAGASQHAAVLREAGLITTRRNRNAVLHSVTPLGSALLAGQLWPVGCDGAESVG